MNWRNDPRVEAALREMTAWWRFLALHAECAHASGECKLLTARKAGRSEAKRS